MPQGCSAPRPDSHRSEAGDHAPATMTTPLPTMRVIYHHSPPLLLLPLIPSRLPLCRIGNSHKIVVRPPHQS